MLSGPDTYTCPLCRMLLAGAINDSYSGCSACGSYVYCSSQSAEEDNRAYFDAVYRTVSGYVVDARKQRIFSAGLRRDQKNHKEASEAFEGHQTRVRRMLAGEGRRVLEIGFGEGTVLAELLSAGTDAWGEELSVTALENFATRFPVWAHRVGKPASAPGKFDFIYCSALFEHLDDPVSFLVTASARLSGEGHIVIDNFPLVVPGPADTSPEDDICFWKPCHRLLCTTEGLQRMTSASGLRVPALAMHDAYLYRVLSLHRRHGYLMIERMRNPFLRHADFPGRLRFWMICRQALRVQSRCRLASAVLAQI